jgi:MEMO1 family protein
MSSRVRPPAVAGHFYPGDPGVLEKTVDALLERVHVTDGTARAYVTPHAGYVYSGPTAAHAYAQLRPNAETVARVVLIGPSHFVPLQGCAVPTADAWQTPLGTVPIDTTTRDALGDLVLRDDGPHAPEHSLEVQLPFLQRSLGPAATVLPIAVGHAAPETVARILQVAAGPGAVVICSTDLSHYLDEASANDRDAHTVESVIALAPEQIGVRDACGVFALRGLVEWARTEALTPMLLHRSTSADTAGDASRVVGYAAISLT